MAAEDAEETAPSARKGVEDRKAQAAMDALEVRGEDEASSATAPVDASKMGEAMRNLGGEGGAASVADKTTAVRKDVKIRTEDVGYLAEQFDLSKAKATEMIRRFGGLDEAVVGLLHGHERI
ncbi:MAG: hypothetical protein M1814_005814 [Vezdaea aestivalis]|nr:MAG: hypothetical protein M1814_005814 [Vezdaea aestivalis]